MVPIVEKQRQNEFEYSFKSFVEKFIEICNQHIENKQAKAFAFLLYDFKDKNVKHVLKTSGAFTLFDRLAGKDISIFYLHSGSGSIFNQFNYVFLEAFQIHQSIDQLPIILFFKIRDNEVTEIKVANLKNRNSILLFREMYDVIESYIDKIGSEDDKARKIFRATKELAIERFIKILIERGIESTDSFI